jgi:hypothetical protein
VIVLILLHSVVDYPLRTPTLSVLFAIACAFLIPPRNIERGVSQMSRETGGLVPDNGPWPRSQAVLSS